MKEPIARAVILHGRGPHGQGAAKTPLYSGLRTQDANLKVRGMDADILSMHNDNKRQMPFDSEDPCFLEARALALSVMTIRKARGQTNPSDHEPGSEAAFIVDEDFARDVMRMMTAVSGVAG